MYPEIVPVKIFAVSDQPVEAFDFQEKNIKTEIHLFKDYHALLTHIHLEPDFVFIFELKDSAMTMSDFIQNISLLSPASQLICISADPQVEEAVRLMKKGINDYISVSNFNGDYLKSLLESYTGEPWNTEKKTAIVDKFRDLGFGGTGRRMRKLYTKLEDVSKSDINLLIEGESGTELQLAASAVHRLSKRRDAPFLLFDVLAFPADSVEFELFGREKDSAAGILKRKIGAIETASGGCLCIENIDALPTHLQSRLLRAIREKKYLKPGGPNIVFWNARLITISNKSLEKAVKEKVLREDLYYQIASFNIRIPALRDRGQDIIAIANNFLRTFTRLNRLKSLTFSAAARDLLLQYSFPGNVVELKSLVESAALMAKAEEIEKEDLVFRNKPLTELPGDTELSLEEYTEKIIKAYLEKYNNDVLLVAAKLGIGKSTIYRMLKTHKNTPKTAN